ncbi:HAD family hydrolase [Candidatus Albibeggiatoa sp. nov. NOAA]|uniref:HAD family hydrolase n=1 Tax=Candidatus Albibeggiatoa sp. nov. NOAA TaxID=3162724 RepID=UPI00333F0BD5
MSIRVICFDLDDTLWPVDSVIRHAENALRQWFYRYYPRIPQNFSISDMQAMRQELLREQPELYANLHELRRINIKQVVNAVGYDEAIIEPALDIFDNARHKVKPYHDVIPALERLYKNYTLCALTNGTADVKRIDKLARFFTVSLRAGDVGHAKPHPALFETACQRCEVEPEQVLHIGDHVDSDVLGALQAGMHAIWMNRKKQDWNAEHQPHAIIHSLEELDNVLKQGL